MSNALLVVGGAIFVLMGVVHGALALADIVRPRWFTPADDAVRVAMRSTTVRFLDARACVWDAWLGFNISHSLGMLLFGAAALATGVQGAPPAAAAVAAGVGAIYVALSLRFWFWAPAAASIAATACFAVAWWS